MVIHVPSIDIVAALWFVVCWAGYSAFAQILSRRCNSLLVIVNEYRLNWMRQMLKRENRMVDATLMGNLLRSISFFANTSIFILFALFALLKYNDETRDILTNIPYVSPVSPILWEMKVFLLVLICIYTFFKYTWSMRQYNYACVIIGAAPLSNEENPHLEQYAQNGAKLIGGAAAHFNMGLRGYYFSIAALSWFVSAWAFIISSTIVVMVLYRREFQSRALQYMVDGNIGR